MTDDHENRLRALEQSIAELRVEVRNMKSGQDDLKEILKDFKNEIREGLKQGRECFVRKSEVRAGYVVFGVGITLFGLLIKIGVI